MSEEFTREDLLEVWRRDLDPGYTIPLETEAEGRGLDVISGLAALFARASSSVQLTTQSLYLREHSTQLDPPSSGGARATGQLVIRRETPSNGDVTIQVGAAPIVQGVQTNPDGDEIFAPNFVITGPTPDFAYTFPAGSTGPLEVDIQAQREGFQGNVEPGRRAVFQERSGFTAEVDTISAEQVLIVGNGNEFTDANVGMYIRVTLGVNAGAPAAIITNVPDATAQETRRIIADIDSLFVDQTGGEIEVIDLGGLGFTATIDDGTSGGRSAELDFIARERDAARAIGETDEEFRDRLINLADRVSPNALIRAIETVLDPANVDFQFIEVASSTSGMTFSPLVTDPNIGSFFDDPFGYRKRTGFFSAGGGFEEAFPIGFLVVVNGQDLPSDPNERNSILSRLVTTVFDRKGGGVPWVIAFEPPIP